MENPADSAVKTDRRGSAFRVALISTPWALFHRPSIQLAGLAAYLRGKSTYRVESHHLYLNIAAQLGVDLYTRISKSGWAGEALFAPLLFPEKKEDAAHLFNMELRNDGQGQVPDFDRLSAAILKCCESWLKEIDQQEISLCGFSICFNQLLPSLYLALRLKEDSKITTVFGGTSCSSEAGLSLVSHFSQIDYLVDGEGEKVLLELCHYLDGKRSTLPSQIRSRHTIRSARQPSTAEQLDDLPIPSFGSYLSEVKKLFADMPFMPVLPVEFSRGCSWNRCTFCNLNLQWEGYRHKRAKRMAVEIEKLSAETESLNFSFTDNVLPAGETDIFFTAMSKSDRDLSFFAEIRAKTSIQRLQLFHSGGLRTVQVGIESLSTSLLARMGKGTRVIDNLTIMKNCAAVGIKLRGNLITEFPGSSAEEVKETLENLEYAFPYAPLDAVGFFLGYGSPIYRHPQDYGIRSITAHPQNRMLFPLRFQKLLIACGYRGDRTLQRRRWRPVREKIRAWQHFHRSRASSNSPPLYYRDGGTFIVIHQQLPDDSSLLHRLRGLSRELYLYCQQPTELVEICTAYPGVRREAIETFVTELCSKRLMFREDDRILALAFNRA